jgi:hypothetical protein
MDKPTQDNETLHYLRAVLTIVFTTLLGLALATLFIYAFTIIFLGPLLRWLGAGPDSIVFKTSSGILAISLIAIATVIFNKVAAEENHNHHSRWLGKWTEFEEGLEKLALPCPSCQTVAPPLPSTCNRYRCSCGNQFASDPHNLVLPLVPDPRLMRTNLDRW